MFDSHYYPENWGVRPALFNIGGYEAPSYSFFVFLALAAGVGFYIYQAHKDRRFNDNAIFIVMAALVFGTLGAKIPIWIANYRDIAANADDLGIWMTGRTIVGGLVGGWLGVYLIKRYLNIKVRLGNYIAPAAALGMAVGRIGCFLRGCCYGVPTDLFWGVDFGDGLLRHPTQIYESMFDLGLFFYLLHLQKKITRPGQLFVVFLTIYLSFRFLIEFIRAEPRVFMGMTGYQAASLAVVVIINWRSIFNVFRKRREGVGQ